MIIRSKLLFLFCVTTLFSTDRSLSKKSIEDSSILGIFPIDRFIFHNIPKEVPKAFTHRLDEVFKFNRLEATFTRAELLQSNEFITGEFIKIRDSAEYSRVPKLLISLQTELGQLNIFLSEAEQIAKDEKADKYTSIKPTLDQIISKVNEAIQEAVKETVYSSEDIEAAYAKLLQLGDALDLMSNELAREINFDSKMLPSDPRKELYSTLIELRNALARDEEFMNIIVHLRSRLGTIYRVSFPDYERARTEAYYVLKLAREKMGWNDNHLDEAIKDTKKLLTEMCGIQVNDWKDLIPEMSHTHVKGMRYIIEGDDRSKERFKENEPKDIELVYLKGKMRIFNLGKELGLEWIKLCEIFETVYEKQPTEKSEELYRLLCSLGDFDHIYRSRQFLFFPWFNPMTHTRRLRRLYTGLHFFKSALYAPLAKPFALDMMHSITDHLESYRNKEASHMCILNEAAFKTFVENVAEGSNPAFFNCLDTPSYLTMGLNGTSTISKHYIRTCLSFLREIQFDTFYVEKKLATKHELSILKRMENYEIPLMLEILEYRYDIVQWTLYHKAISECETDVGSNGSTSSSDSSTK